ncbi:MAG: recombinase family protein [Phycisphaera sp.]|nr:recombinase family protein [Phycisphaera sp.]
MKRAVAYIRVSTSDQALDGVSLDAQRAKIEAWARANDYDLVEAHTDRGISGKATHNRPALHDALAAACRQKAVLVVYSLSRLARSTKDAIDISERLERCGADLVSLSEQLDTTSAAGKMLFKLLAVLAEFESDTVSERTKAAMAYKRSRDERTSRFTPYGYTLDVDGKRLLPDPDEQQVIRKMTQMRQRGQTYRTICRNLEKQGVRSKRGKGRWSPTVVRKIIQRADERELVSQ